MRIRFSYVFGNEGCGWTEACSSGAVAAFLAANSLRRTMGEVNIMQSGGKSVIYWIKAHESVGLKLNPAYVGSIEYEIKDNFTAYIFLIPFSVSLQFFY